MKITELVDGCRCTLSIAIEGSDAVGKQTQTRMLVDRLRSIDLAATGVEVPVDDNVTYDMIYNMLNDGRALKYPATLQGLFITNRLIFQTMKLPKLLMKNDVIVFDRWNGSTYAYGRAAGLSVDELACVLPAVAVPDITILLNGAAHAKTTLDVYESDATLQERVAAYYIEWAHMLSGRTYIIDADDTCDAVHEAVWCAVSTELDITSRRNVIDITPHLHARRIAAELMKKIDEIEGDGGGDGDGPTVA
jgi:dTMP kinase